MSDQDKPHLKYYEAEMRYLHEASKAFSAEHPDTARRLGLTGLGAREDSVERLYQGFAFLMGRLRMKLDDALPEITNPLIDNVWPHAGRTIPSLAILECVPRLDAARAPDTLIAGLQVRSSPVGPEGTVCIYRTTQSVRLLPLRVHEAGPAVRADGRTVIRIAFELQHVDRRSLDDLSRIRLYLHGDRPTASALYAAFTRQVDAIGVRMPQTHEGRVQPQPRMTIEAVGFGPGSRLWPAENGRPNRELDREQTMLEYFTFPEKYHFVDLCGFDAKSVPDGETRLEFEITLNGRLASDVTFDADHIRLFCTPVINLFEIDAQPLQPNAHDRDYPVLPPAADGKHIEPYQVLSVVAADLESAEQHAYEPFRTFRHHGGMLRHEAAERYFHTSMDYGVAGGRQMWITLGGHVWDRGRETVGRAAGEEFGTVPDKHVAVRVLANNGMLPRMALRESAITTPVLSAGGIGSVRNLTQPTTPFYPPRDRQYQWQVISHFSGREFDVLNTDVLRGVLALYDWTGQDDNASRIEAIREVWIEPGRVIRKGYVLREFGIHVEIDPAGFAGPGDVVLFGDVLSHFIGRYACYQYSVRLVLRSNGNETVYPSTEFTGSVM
ncbi:type VI secretion system baseplate subunit TssF [Paraburkholderia sp. IW21]|uniref:type VI secretion system baseplate subunit TssF n=1 Tax=Paraburkholderia sp. IW21 TaxID=3242488 RepID=UPI0035210989